MSTPLATHAAIPSAMPCSSPSTSPANLTRATAQATASVGTAPPRRWVTDAPMRMFHWLFALSFVGAYLTAESERWRVLHVSLGYAFAALLGLRVVYGLLGPRPARLSVLLRKLQAARGWAQACLTPAVMSAAHWRQAQNLAMAWAVAALLVMVLPLVLTGHASYNDWGDAWGWVGEAIEELHEGLGEAYLAVVLTHLGLLLGLSVLRRKNQVFPMLTGRLSGPGANLVAHQRHWLAAGVLLAYAGLLTWLLMWPV